jgi:hypothetical protein
MDVNKKSYLIKPCYKKNIIELERFYKIIDNKYYYLHTETLFRSGSFIVSLYDEEELPDNNINELIITDFCDYEMIELIDGCCVNYNLYDSNFGLIDEGPIYDEVIKEIESGYIEDYGWNYNDNEYMIYNGFMFEEVKD